MGSKGRVIGLGIVVVVIVVIALLVDLGPKGVWVFGEIYLAENKETYNIEDGVLIKSMEEYEEFAGEHPERRGIDRGVAGMYNETFFRDKVIYAYITEESSSSNKLSVGRAEINKGELKVYIKRDKAEIGTTDMAINVCLIELYKKDIEGINKFKVIIDDLDK